MPDLRPDDGPDEVYLPPALRPGGGAPLTSRLPREPRDDRRVPLTRTEMLAAAQSLLDELLGGLVRDEADRDAAVRALMALGRCDGRRPDRRPLSPLGDEPGVPVVATRLGREVRDVLETHVEAPVSDAVVMQATLGVEFAAQVEAAGPGASSPGG